MLDGIQVIDCARELSGSVAAMVMAEAGADVVKVESPGGDARRGSPEFATWNRSKAGVVLDPFGADRGAFDRLIAGADVLIHDWTDAETVELSLDDQSLRKRAPHLICSRIAAVPAHANMSEFPLDDVLVLAATGVLAEQPAVNRDGPSYISMPMGSWCAAWLAATGIAARLVHVRRGGTPGPIDTSIFQGAMVPVAMLWRHSSTPTPSFDGRIDKNILPSIFECSDGVWLHIMRNVDEIPLMKQLLLEMGPDRRAAANAQWPPHFRYPNWGGNVEAFRSRPSDEWLAELWAHDVPVQPALPMGSLYADDQAAANRYVVEVKDVVLGDILVPGHPVTLDPPARIIAPAPRLNTDRASIGRLTRPARSAPSAASGGGNPLSGIKVVDFGNYLAGPLSTMLLADLGADVIKVEALDGDPMRANESAFLSCQRGKRSLTLDLKHPDARRVIERLVGDADIVHHNLRLPSARKLGLSFDDLRRIKANIIFSHVSAYGPSGPRRDWPGYDQLFQACTGWECANAGEGNRPVWLRFGMMDHLCAMAACWGTLLAVAKREVSGEGSQIAASLLGTSVLTMSSLAMRRDGSLIGERFVLDTEQFGLSPGRRLMRCSDGWLAIKGPDDAAPASEEIAAVNCADAIATLKSRGFTVARVRTDQGHLFLQDADHLRTGLVARYDHPIYGELRHPGAFWTMPDLTLALQRSPPALGQHTTEILEEYGFSKKEIARLRSVAVIGP
jgi:crotonobetainyl-CoA:carnitine CoA-transferase CaiB-like acyl-CoA transferase